MREQIIPIGVQVPVFFTLLDRFTNEAYESDTLTVSSISLTIIRENGTRNTVDVSAATPERISGNYYKVVLSSVQSEVTGYKFGVLALDIEEAQPIQISLQFVAVANRQLGSSDNHVAPKENAYVALLSFLDSGGVDAYTGSSLSNVTISAVDQDDVIFTIADSLTFENYGALWSLDLTASELTTSATSITITITADEITEFTFTITLLAIRDSDVVVTDCIEALITANIISTLEGITFANDYNTDVEYVTEMSSEFKSKNGNHILVQVDNPNYNEDYDHTGDVDYRFTLIYFAKYNDRENDNSFQNKNKNVVADIIKALMVDRTRNGYSQNTIIEDHGHEIFMGENGETMHGTYVLLSTPCLINANNPYQLGA